MNDNSLAGRIRRLKYPHARIPTSTNSDKRSKLWGLSVFCLFVFLSVTGVDGGYSEWSSWSKCSATCGGGVSWSHRTCTKPSPSGDGKTCKEQNLGPDKKSKECNTQKCGKMTFHYYMKYFITYFLFWIPMRNSAMPWTNLWWERQYLCQSVLVYLEFFPRCIDGLFNWNIHYQKLLKRQERTKNYSVLNTALSRIDFRLELQEGRN